MAKITEIKLSKATNWHEVAIAERRLLSADEPKQLDADDWAKLVERHTPTSDVSVTMHTTMTYGEAMDYALAQQKAKRNLKKGETFDEGWFIVSYFATGWTLKNAETGELLPFTQAAMRDAAASEVGEVIDLCQRVANGIDPNA